MLCVNIENVYLLLSGELKLKFVLQRVLNARVDIGGVTVGKIGKGYLLLAGIAQGDDFTTADKMLEKISKLRIFEDENGKTNLSLSNVAGEVLIVSQFTLYADAKKGNRPSFVNAAKPDKAEEIYNHIISKGNEIFGRVECGKFGADMKVSLLNDGPFTLVLDSEEILR